MKGAGCPAIDSDARRCPECSGVLLGIAIRTGSPLSLSLAEPVWKQLAGMSLTIADLSEVRPGVWEMGSPGVLSFLALGAVGRAWLQPRARRKGGGPAASTRTSVPREGGQGLHPRAHVHP